MAVAVPSREEGAVVLALIEVGKHWVLPLLPSRGRAHAGRDDLAVRHGARRAGAEPRRQRRIAAVLGAFFILYPGSLVTTWIAPIFVVRVPAWIWLGPWFLYQLIEGSFGLFKAGPTGVGAGRTRRGGRLRRRERRAAAGRLR